jgi:hypothetical protein
MANGNKAHKLMGAGAATLIAEPALAMAHQGGLGIIVGLVIGAVAYGIVDEVEQRTGGQLALPGRNQSLATEKAERRSDGDGKSKLNLAHRLLVGKSIREAEAEAANDDTDDETTVITDPDSDVEEDAAFTHQEAETDTPGVQRLTMEQIVRNTQRNSYEVYIGRSMTRPGNPAIKINFYKRHLKLIGASQHGKSSEAAALLEAILRTHDPKHVQVSLLDLEHKTSRLFADAPHVLKLRIDGEVVRFHARSYDEVLQHLGYLSSVIDHRYTLSDEELDQLPLILVYLEEFIDLKDYFKQRISAVSAAERDQAKQDYARLVYFIKKIAARGLKVLVQLLMCAQVDYRDEDLQAALINVTSGMSFCVRVSAAQAAGFYQTELLQRNAKEDKVGQAVVEMPDCKDLVLAPEYNLKARLAALSPAMQREPLAFPGMRGEIEQIAATGTDAPAPTMPALTPRPQPTRRVVTVQEAYNAWQEGAKGPRKLERMLNIPYNQARDLFTEMQRQGLIPQENE